MFGVRAVSRQLRGVRRILIGLQIALLVFSMFATVGAFAADPDPSPSDSPAPSAEPSVDPGPSEEPAASADPDPTPAADPEPTATPDPTPAATLFPYIVTFVAGTSGSAQADAIAAAGATDLDSIAVLRMHAVSASDAAAAALRASPSVASVELDRSRAAEGAPDDASYGDQWSLPRIGWDQVYGSVSPSGSAVVAILDTGVDASHFDVDDSLTPGASFVSGASWSSDPNGHGTAMAGIVAAETGNGQGIAGVAFAGVRVMPVTVLGPDGLGRDSDIIEGLAWAADHGADVALLAFSASGYSAALQAAVDYAWSKGVVIVAATGNDGSSLPAFPAGDRGVVGVSNTDQSDTLAPSSNYGTDVFLAAPGTGILTLVPGGGTSSISGTSASAAEVAGAAALLRAVDPSLSAGAVVGRLARSADAVGTVDQTGNGRLNLARALSDASTVEVKPAGAAPVGAGGPFVGPYVAAGSGVVAVTVRDAATNAVISGATVTCTAACTGSGNSGTTNASGVAQFTVNYSGNSETITLQATATGYSASSGTLSVANANNAANPATRTLLLGTTNAAPTVNRDNATRTVNEGQTATNTGTYNDTNATDNVAISASIGTVTKTGTNSGTWSWSLATTDGPNQSQTVTITADDGHGGIATTTFALVVSNFAPTIAVTGAASVNEGSSYSLGLGAVTDPGADTVTSYVVHWGDGATDTYPTAGSKTHVYADGPASRTITVDLVDEDGTFLAAGGTSVTVANVAPAIAATGAASIDEGATYSLTLGAVTDPGADTVTSYVVHWGDGATDTYGAPGIKTHIYDDGPSTPAITVDLVDEDGTFLAAGGTSVAVANVGPTVAITGAPATSPEGTPISIGSSVSDPSGADQTAGFSYAWSATKDGNPFASGTSASIAFTPDDNATYVVELTATDKDGGAGTALAKTIAVTNVSPTATLSVTPGALGEGGSVNVSLGSPLDPSSADVATGFHYSFACDGLGASLATTYAAASATASTSCAFDDNGSFTVLARILDKDGGSSDSMAGVTVSNLAPTGIFVAPTILEGGTSNLHFESPSDPSAADVAAGLHFDFSCTSLLDDLDLAYATTSTTNGFGCSFADEGSFGVEGAIIDKDNGSLVAGGVVTVSNVAPTVTAPADQTADEGVAKSFSLGSFSDPGVLDAPWAVAIDWGDGDTTSAIATSQGFLADASHTYGDNGTYTVSVTVTDKDGALSSPQTFDVVVANVAPTAIITGAPTTRAEGTSISVDSEVSDVAADEAAGFTYAWSVTKDGAPFASGSTESFAFTPDDNGTYVVGLTVTDQDGGAGVAPAQTIVVTNAAPTATLGNDGPVSEGSSATILFTGASDPSTADTTAGFHYAFSCANADLSAAAYDASGASASTTCLFADNGTFTVKGRIIDKDGGFLETTTVVQVDNVAPTVDAGAATGSSAEGSAFVRSGSFSDPGADTWTATVDYGDGGGAGTLALIGTAFNLSHVYADDGSHTITVTVTDDDGGIGTDTILVTVANVAPTVDAGAATGSSAEGSAFTRSGSFSDPGADTWTATVDYGDGAGPVTLALTGSTFGLSHVYADDGSHTITVTVTDDDGGIGTDTILVTVANVDPIVTIDGGSISVQEAGVPTTYSYHWTDPGADTWTRTTTCGASGVKSGELFNTSAKTGSFACTWADDLGAGPANGETVSVTVSDDDAGSDTETRAVTVNNVTPVVSVVSVVLDPFTHVATATGTFSDVGTADTHTASVVWTLDGAVQGAIPGTVIESAGSGTASATLLVGPGCHTIRADVTVTDDDTGTATNGSSGTAFDAYDIQFRAPIKDDVRNIAKAGSTIPVKVVINKFCGGTTSVTNVDLYVSIAAGIAADEIADITPNVVLDAGASNDNGLKMRIADGGYIYNFSTKQLSDKSDYTLRIRLGSSTGPILKTAVIRTQK